MTNRKPEQAASEAAEDCVFCKILDGVYPISEVYADDMCVGLMDIAPVNTGHVLVIPRAHMSYLADVPEDLAGHCFKVGHRLAAALRSSGLPCDGVNMFVADGEASGQEVFHFHLHIFPRVEDDGFGLKYDERHFQQPPRAELNRIAGTIRAQMAASDKD